MSTYLCLLRQFLFDWQTLIAGILALGAALLTVKRMNYQNALQERAIQEAAVRFNDQSERRTWAYRAKLIDTIDLLSNYTDLCIQRLTGRSLHLEPSPPDVKMIQESIEYLDPQSAKAMFQIVAKLQVQWARLRPYLSEPHEAEWAYRIYDAIELKALVDRVFPYVRNTTETAQGGPVSRAELAKAWRLTGDTAPMAENQHLAIQELIDRCSQAENEN